MLESLRRAFTSFLAVPTGVIVGFVLLAISSYSAEQADLSVLRPVRDFMKSHVFGDAAATSALLGTVAGGIITITSITLSILLLALQQSAGSLTHQVVDQFLRRRTNQVYFGAFVGITLYSLITLATVNPPFNPVLGASLALILTIIALYVLLLLIYATINQMRPEEIIKTIHDHTLRARERQLPLIHRTWRVSEHLEHDAIPAKAPGDGFMTGIDLDMIEAAVHNASAPVEIEYTRSIGAYVAFQDAFATVRAERREDAERLAEEVEHATVIGHQRNLDNDPAYGINQLATIAWRSISTSQQNPAPGISTIHNLHDLLARWAIAEQDDPDDERLPVVYPDNVMARLLAAFESLAVVASEAMQHQTYAEIVQVFALIFEKLAAPEQQRAEDLLLRSISGLGDHVPTRELDAALIALVESLSRAGRIHAATAISAARVELGQSIGKLNSRATRVPTGG